MIISSPFFAFNAQVFAMSDLGSRLKSIRLSKKLTLERLASKSGVTKGFLSQVESGAKGPSVSTLLRIAQALDVSLSSCFDDLNSRNTAVSVVRKNERKSFERVGSQYGFEYEAIAYRKQKKKMEPFIMSPPLSVPTEHFQHPGDEMIFVISGRLRVWLKNKPIDLNAGDCIYFDATVPHRSQSLGKMRGKALLVISVDDVRP
jgi:transcriptional regulator with XRE-family HTH domain